MVKLSVLCREYPEDFIFHNSFELSFLSELIKMCYSKYINVDVISHLLPKPIALIVKDTSVPRVFDCFLEFDVEEIYPEYLEELRDILGDEFIEKFLAVCSFRIPECIILRNPSNTVTSIETYDWEEYWRKMYPRFSEHLQISSRMFGCNSGCAIHNRLYVRRDGALVFSHDEYGRILVHVLRLKNNIERRLAELYSSAT